ncbi:LOG family protein [Marinobacterium arenosum]|uniref:LOG family protein n=1 Tax=Marinobacterium arenosum TaxID=2862496 RepID=UPI001C98568D|nr:TIGR00730 family Rossman fold protein [Marinobacterium arenosum]MBY4676337.1 TIGR00730 family Rossman fold protein [Marinobacterium arenosum]
MKIAVYCGSSFGASPTYRQAAEAMGQALAARDIELVFGGGNVGLMGTVADAVLKAGGRATGIITEDLQTKEIAHPGLTRLEIVDNMHTRKARMSELADGYIAMPGGVGTMEEIFEVWTWGQLGYHRKPCAFLNVNGYYDRLVDFVDNMVSAEFMRPHYREMVTVHDQPELILDAFARYQPPAEKWVNNDR